jgi:hypothetical protein
VQAEVTVHVARKRGEPVPGRMAISSLTAKTHINRAMTKLDARDRAQLVVFAYESGLGVPRGS